MPVHISKQGKTRLEQLDTITMKIRGAGENADLEDTLLRDEGREKLRLEMQAEEQRRAADEQRQAAEDERRRNAEAQTNAAIEQAVQAKVGEMTQRFPIY